MTRRPRHNARLRDRDYEILKHVERYRLTTPEILHQQLFFRKDEDGKETTELMARNAVTKVTSRLCTDGFLKSHPLYGSNSYFTLGRLGAKRIGLPASRVENGIKPQSLYRDFGVLYFCCRSAVPRQKLRFSEVQDERPNLIAKGIDSSHYYLDKQDKNDPVRLAYIWVEAGGTMSHITNKVKHDFIGARRTVPALRQLIDEGRFVVAIVTYLDQRREEIVRALLQIPTTVAFRVEVVPELRDLLP